MFGHKSLLNWMLVYGAVGVLYAGPSAQAQGPGIENAEVQGGGIFEDDQAAVDGDPHAIPPGQSVSVGSFGQIDLHVKDLEISRVLQLLSIQSQRNIVASRNVAGTLSADLYAVEFYDALDAILQPNGFGYREKGNFVYVYTASEIKELEEAERKLTSRVLRLNYINAADASAFATPLLSANGAISLSGEAPPGFQPSISDNGAKDFAHTDTLIIRDYAENVDEIVALLKELDTRPKQVLVEATILQAAIDEANAFGVDFSILADYTLNQFVKPLNTVDALINGTVDGEVDSVFGAVGSGESVQSTVGNTLNGESGVKFGILNSEFAVFVRALDRVTDTTIIANPKLLVINRQRADLLVGGRLGYLSTTSTDTSTTQTVEFLDIGTQLTVRPFVSEDDYIRMELRPSISDGSTASVGGVVIPNETTQEMTTNIMVRSGQTVVLGGLFKEDTTVSRSQWPWVADVPVIGNAFKGKDDDVDRSEVIFLVKPTIVKDDALYLAGEQASEGIEHLRLGARRGLLPWSRSKMTAGHMRDAWKHYRVGNVDKALWCVNLALWLEPTLAEGRQLKEEITGRQMGDWPGNGILNNSIQRMIDHQMGRGTNGDAASSSVGFELTDALDGDQQDTGLAQTEATTVIDAADPHTDFWEPSTADDASSVEESNHTGEPSAADHSGSVDPANQSVDSDSPTNQTASQRRGGGSFNVLSAIGSQLPGISAEDQEATGRQADAASDRTDRHAEVSAEESGSSLDVDGASAQGNTADPATVTAVSPADQQQSVELVEDEPFEDIGVTSIDASQSEDYPTSIEDSPLDWETSGVSAESDVTSDANESSEPGASDAEDGPASDEEVAAEESGETAEVTAEDSGETSDSTQAAAEDDANNVTDDATAEVTIEETEPF